MKHHMKFLAGSIAGLLLLTLGGQSIFAKITVHPLLFPGVVGTKNVASTSCDTLDNLLGYEDGKDIIIASRYAEKEGISAFSTIIQTDNKIQYIDTDFLNESALAKLKEGENYLFYYAASSGETDGAGIIPVVGFADLETNEIFGKKTTDMRTAVIEKIVTGTKSYSIYAETVESQVPYESRVELTADGLALLGNSGEAISYFFTNSANAGRLFKAYEKSIRIQMYYEVDKWSGMKKATGFKQCM